MSSERFMKKEKMLSGVDIKWNVCIPQNTKHRETNTFNELIF